MILSFVTSFLPYGIGIETIGLNTNRVRLKHITLYAPCPTLSHLAAAGIAGA
jgi:hypothetical protein